jgi:hypothetical protein
MQKLLNNQESRKEKERKEKKKDPNWAGPSKTPTQLANRLTPLEHTETISY